MFWGLKLLYPLLYVFCFYKDKALRCLCKYTRINVGEILGFLHIKGQPGKLSIFVNNLNPQPQRHFKERIS